MASRKLEAANAGGMRKLIKLAEKAKNCVVDVNMGRLELESVQMEVYSDASFWKCGRWKISDRLHNRVKG